MNHGDSANFILQKYNCSFLNCIEAADQSAASLVNILARDFSCFRDEVRFEGRKTVRILKRAQILVADLWACFDGLDHGEFYDIDKITMFADYRIPQILNSLGCMQYSPLLETTLRKKKIIETGHSWEIQIRGMLEDMLVCRTRLTKYRLQYLVCGAHQERDSQTASRHGNKCHINRLLPLRYGEGAGEGTGGEDRRRRRFTSSPNARYLVLSHIFADSSVLYHSSQ